MTHLIPPETQITELKRMGDDLDAFKKPNKLKLKKKDEEGLAILLEERILDGTATLQCIPNELLKGKPRHLKASYTIQPKDLETSMLKNEELVGRMITGIIRSIKIKKMKW